MVKSFCTTVMPSLEPEAPEKEICGSPTCAAGGGVGVAVAGASVGSSEALL